MGKYLQPFTRYSTKEKPEVPKCQMLAANILKVRLEARTLNLIVRLEARTLNLIVRLEARTLNLKGYRFANITANEVHANISDFTISVLPLSGIHVCVIYTHLHPNFL